MLGTDRRNLKEQQSSERKRRAQASRNKYKDLCHLSSSRITKAETKDNVKKMLDSVFGNQKENLATTDRRYLMLNHDFRDSFSSNPATPQASLATHVTNNHNPDQVTQQRERNSIGLLNSQKLPSQKLPINESQTATSKNSSRQETRPTPHYGGSQTVPVKDSDFQNKCGEQKTNNLDCAQHAFLDKTFDFTSPDAVATKLDKLLKEISIPSLLMPIHDVALNVKAPNVPATTSQILQKEDELPKDSVSLCVKEEVEESAGHATTFVQNNSTDYNKKSPVKNSRPERNWLESVGKQMSPTAPLKVKRSQLSLSVSLEEGEIRDEGSKRVGQLQKHNGTINDVIDDDSLNEAAFELANSEKFCTTLGISKETAECLTLEERMNKAKVLVYVFGGQISDIDDEEDEEQGNKDDNIDKESKTTKTCLEDAGEKNSIVLEDGEIQEERDSNYSVSNSSSASPSDSSVSESSTTPLHSDLPESLIDNNEQSQRNWSLSFFVEDMKKEFVINPPKPSPVRSAFTARGGSCGQPLFKPSGTQDSTVPIEIEKSSSPVVEKLSQQDLSARPTSRNESIALLEESSKAFTEVNSNSEKQFDSSNVLVNKSKSISHSKNTSKDSLETKESKVKGTTMTGAIIKQNEEVRKKSDVKLMENVVKLVDESKKGEAKKSGKKSVEIKLPEVVDCQNGSSFASAMQSLSMKNGSKKRLSQQINKNSTLKETAVSDKKDVVKVEVKEEKKRKFEELNETNDKPESDRNSKKFKPEVHGIILKFDKEKIARLEKMEKNLKRKADEENSVIESKKVKVEDVEAPVKSKFVSRADKEVKRKINESMEIPGENDKLKKNNKKVTNNDIDKKSMSSSSSKSESSKSSLDADCAMKQKIHEDLFQKVHKVLDKKSAVSKTKSNNNSIKKAEALSDDSLSGFPKLSTDIKTKSSNNSIRKVEAPSDDSLSSFPKLSTDIKTKSNNSIKKIDAPSDDSSSGFPKLSIAVKTKSSSNSIKKVNAPSDDSLKPSTDVPNRSLAMNTSTVVDNSVPQKDRQRPASETPKKSSKDKKVKLSDSQQTTSNKSKLNRTPRSELSKDRTDSAVQSKSKKNLEDSTPDDSRGESSKTLHLNALCERLANPEVMKNRSESLCSDSISSVIVVHLMVTADLLARYVRDSETRPEAFDIKGLKNTISSLEFLTKEVTDEADKDKLHYMLWSLEAMVYYHYHKFLKSQKDVNYLNATIDRLQEQIMGHNSPKASPDSSSASCLKEFQNLLKSGTAIDSRSSKTIDKTKPDKNSSDDLTYIFSFSHIALGLVEKLGELETRPSCSSLWKQFGKFNISMNLQEWIKWLNSITQPFKTANPDSLPL